MAARAPFVLAVLAASAVAAWAEVRQVDHFAGVHASDGIEVHVNVSVDGSSSLVLDSTAEASSEVRSQVDRWGTLILTRAAGAGSSHVVVQATVPGPLTYAGATSEGSVLAGAVAGPMVASSHSRIVAESLESARDVSVTASDFSSITLSGGHVPGFSVSCSSTSSISLGELRADKASISVSSRSSISGMTVGTATATASDVSSLTFTVTGHVGLSCSSSEVRIGGSGSVTTWSDWACKVEVPSAKAAASALATAPVFP